MGHSALMVGEKAPPFTLQAGSGAIVRLSDFLGKRVVLYFYPKDDTPGCTKEACGFRDGLAKFARANAVVVGMSCDTGASHQRFAKKFQLTFPLLSDPDAAVCKAYGVYKQKSMYGRTYWGIERTTFILDEAGRIAAIFPKVSVDGHTEAVFQSLRETRSSQGATVRSASDQPIPRRARAATRSARRGF